MQVPRFPDQILSPWRISAVRGRSFGLRLSQMDHVGVGGEEEIRGGVMIPGVMEAGRGPKSFLMLLGANSRLAGTHPCLH